MGTCCSKSTDNKHPCRRQKDRLNFYEDLSQCQKDRLNIILEELVTKAGVDFSNPEIKDIQSAVIELLDRIKIWINERGVLRISRIESCGSMAEKTAIWKYDVVAEEFFIELDFLAVLQAACNIKADCQECFCVNTPPVNLELLEIYYCSLYKSCLSCRYILEECFTRETNECLASCGCLEVIYTHPRIWKEYTFEPTCSETQQGCDKCTVDRPTGILRVKTSVQIGNYLENNCSLIFDWTSKAKTLCTRGSGCLPETEKMDNLTIHIDFLPVLELFQSEKQYSCVAACSSSDLVLNPASSEYEHYCFLVPKHCVVCDKYGYKGTWRMSCCRTEIDTIVNKMSDKHRKCYRMLKHLTGFTIELNNYHLKIAVLHHTDAGEDCAKCMFQMLDELQHAYETGQLKSLHSQANLLEEEDCNYCNYSSENIFRLKIAMCSALPESGSVSSFLKKVKSLYWKFKYRPLINFTTKLHGRISASSQMRRRV